MALEDISQGSRLEIAGIKTLDEADQAIYLLLRKGVPEDAEFHCYVRGDGFAIWTGASQEE